MPEFTSELHEILRALDQKYLSYISTLHETIEEYGYRVAALEKVLYERGLATPQEIHAAEDEIRAALMVEKAVNPKIRAAQETIRTLLGDA
jgi:hypothetical protein